MNQIQMKHFNDAVNTALSLNSSNGPRIHLFYDGLTFIRFLQSVIVSVSGPQQHTHDRIISSVIGMYADMPLGVVVHFCPEVFIYTNSHQRIRSFLTQLLTMRVSCAFKP